MHFSQQNTRKLVQLIAPVFFGMIVVIGTACQSAGSPAEASQKSATPPIVAQPTQEATVTATPMPTPPAISEENPITLTFWTVESISPLAENEVGNFFDVHLQDFEQDNPQIEVNTLVKKTSGKGGILDFLRTSRKVAPSVLPDVAIISSIDLHQAYSEELLQTLDGRLDRSIVQDLLPAARRMGTVNDSLIGVPLGLEMEHTVYDTRVFTETPILWTDIFSSNARYLFPAKGVNGLVNDATLAQYFSVGGDFVDDEGTLQVDESALRTVLNIYEQGRENGIVDASLLEAASVDDLWPFYSEIQAGLSQISVQQYLLDRDTLENSSFASVPVQNEADSPIHVMNAWMLVLITENVERQDAALRLIESFLSTPNNAAWNRINGSIPIRDTAYQRLAGDDPYWGFLREQLNTARPRPRFASYDRIGRIIQQSIEQVIRGESTADEATTTAIDALAQ